MLNGAFGMSPGSAGKPKRRCLAALHNPPRFQAGARRTTARSRTGKIVECGEVSPLSMPAERDNRRRPPFSRASLRDVGKDEPRAGRGLGGEDRAARVVANHRSTEASSVGAELQTAEVLRRRKCRQTTPSSPRGSVDVVVVIPGHVSGHALGLPRQLQQCLTKAP